jgi:23S rRNA (guanosine2251-2'-O)-methyltransferase
MGRNYKYKKIEDKTARGNFFLYGKNSVFERLKNNSASIKKIFFKEGFKDKDIIKFSESQRIEVEVVSARDLARIKNVENHQGVIAKIKQFAFTDFSDILTADDKRILVFLDSVFDPVNVGAVIRLCACLGGFAVVIPKYNACDITETVLHIASGGENYVPVAKVTNIVSAVRQAKDSGYWVAGTMADNLADSIYETKMPFPLGIVLGSEGKGIRDGIAKVLDLKISIPMEGAPLSLNINTAAAIICYEAVKQRCLYEKK